MKNFSELFEKYKKNLQFLKSYINEFAQQLGVSIESVKKFAGFIPSDQCWVFAERDDKNNIIGLIRRTQDGKKLTVEGSKRGLTYDYNDITKISSEHIPGKENWARATNEFPCPLCGKVGECLLSIDNPKDPSAILCPHVAEGAIQSRPTGFLHIRKDNIDTTDWRQNNLSIPSEILVVEGQSDVLAADTMGFVAVGRPSAQGGIKFLQGFLVGKRVIIIGENDNTAGIPGMEATFDVLKKVCKHTIKVLPPEQFKDLRAWSPTKEEFLLWVDKHGNREENTTILEDISPLILAEKWLKETQHLHGKLLFRRHRQKWFRYKNGAYREIEDDILTQELYTFFENKQCYKIKSDRTKIVVPFELDKYRIEKIQHALFKSCLIKNGKDAVEPFYIINCKPSSEDFNFQKTIVFKNGILDIETGELKPLESNIFVTSILPYDYNPDAQCDLWRQTIVDIFNKHPDSINLLKQWFGYNLIPTNHLEKIMIFVGPPASGKSTITDMLEGILGPDKRAAFNIEDFDNQFGMEPLIGKHAIILAEAHLSGRVDGTKILQKINRISGQDTININRKFKESLSSKLYCRITYVCNNLPKFRDDPQTLRRRVNILSFPNSYEKNPDVTLKDRLKEEIPGIAIWALEGLKDLLQQQHFIIPRTSERCYEELKLLTSPIAGMIDDCCEITKDPGNFISIEQFYDLHTKWFLENGYYTMTRVAFGRALNNACPGIQKTRPLIQGKRIWGYSGVQITPEAYEKYLERPR